MVPTPSKTLVLSAYKTRPQGFILGCRQDTFHQIRWAIMASPSLSRMTAINPNDAVLASSYPVQFAEESTPLKTSYSYANSIGILKITQKASLR